MRSSTSTTELFQEHTRSDTYLAAKAAGDRRRQEINVLIARLGAETIRGCAVLREDVSDFPANFPEFRVVEGCETNLYGARVVEARISCEIDIQALCERLQPLYTLGTVEEGWGSSDHQIQARETTAVDLVYQLPDGVQALLPNVTSYPLQRLDLVQHEDQSGVTGIAQHHEKPLQEVQGSEGDRCPPSPQQTA